MYGNSPMSMYLKKIGHWIILLSDNKNEADNLTKSPIKLLTLLYHLPVEYLGVAKKP